MDNLGRCLLCKEGSVLSLDRHTCFDLIDALENCQITNNNGETCNECVANKAMIFEGV